MRHPIIKEEPFAALISREWSRAKRLLPRYLKRKPKFVWSSSAQLRGAYGRCWRSANMIEVHRDFKRLTDQKEFVLLLRHEFAHIHRPTRGGSHGEEFRELNTRLGGSRYVKSSLTELRKKEAAH